MKPNIVGLGTFPVDTSMGGGKYVINNLLRRVSSQYNIVYLSLVEHDKIYKEIKISQNFINVHIPQDIEQTQIQWEEERKNNVGLFDVIQINHWKNNKNYHNHLKKYLLNADAVILEHPYFANLLKSFNLKIPIIYHAIDVEFKQKKSILKNKILNDVKNSELTACNMATQIWASSESEKKQLETLYNLSKNKTQVLPHGVDVSSLPFISRSSHEKIKSEFKEFSNKTTFVFTGSWHPPNLESVEFIISDLASIDKNYHYLILGSVCDFYYQKHPDKKIPENVTMLGTVSDSEKLELYQLSDFALNPMFSGAGINIKMLEYMSIGIPIITTEFGARGIKISDETVFCNKETFANQLKTILNSNYKTSPSIDENFDIIRKNYDYDILSKKCILFLNKLLKPSYGQLDEIFGNVITELNKMGISKKDPIVKIITKEIEDLTL